MNLALIATMLGGGGLGFGIVAFATANASRHDASDHQVNESVQIERTENSHSPGTD